MSRLMERPTRATTPTATADPSAIRFVVVQVRQALQQTATIGACSDARFAIGSIRALRRSSITSKSSPRPHP